MNVENLQKRQWEGNIMANVAMTRCNILPAEYLKKDQTEFHNRYEYMLSVLGQNHFVIPSLNNERIALQSGAFLLPGYEIRKNEHSITSSLIYPKIKNLNDEFNVAYIIPSKFKKEILEELNLFNVNESTLFPELEHHMNYIKSKKNTEIINYQEKSEYYNEPLSTFYNWRIEEKWKEYCSETPNSLDSITSENHNIATKELEKSIERILSRYLEILADSEKYAKTITVVLIENMEKNNWYSDENVLNEFNNKIQKTLEGCGYSEKIIQQKSETVLKLIIAEYVFRLIQQFM